MKIRIYHERKDEAIVLDVPDGECEIMVENDYRQRLDAAVDKSSVQRRTAQEIMDEDFNKPSFNKNQAETRRHVLLSALDPEERYFADEMDVLSEIIREERYEELRNAVEKLEPQQKELIRRIFWEDEKQADIAREQNVSKPALVGRMKRIYAALKKIL